jgi:hypothetical protein
MLIWIKRERVGRLQRAMRAEHRRCYGDRGDCERGHMKFVPWQTHGMLGQWAAVRDTGLSCFNEQKLTLDRTVKFPAI